MHFGASMFFTDYSMPPQALARALEERDFESVWAPEHSHIPLSRKSPFIMGGDLPKKYFDTMDPFITLTAAALATTTLKVGTGICLVAQRDVFQTAKQVASIDQISQGRFLFGIGSGWNQDEMEDHGTDFKSRHKMVREQIEAMKLIWTQSKPEYHGDLVNFDPMMTWPKPIQKPHPPVLVGGAFPYSARRAIRFGDGWMPQATAKMQTPFSELIPRFRQMAAEADRDPDSLSISIWGRQPDYDELAQYRDLGVERICTSLESETEASIVPLLDEWAAIIERVNRAR